MNLTRRQVKALLDVISSDESRPALCHAQVRKLNGEMVLVATDSYKMVILSVPDIETEGLIPREAITKWYKLATAKDLFNSDIITDMIVTDSDINFPKIESILDNLTEGDVSRVGFTAKYALQLEELAGHPLTYIMHGRNGPMIATVYECKYILMPLRG